MTAERRWYEPPTPRDWRRPSLAELHGLQSSTSLRKSILERTSSPLVGKPADLASYKSSSSSGRSTISEVDRNLLERNLSGIPPIGSLDSPHTRNMRPPAGVDGRPYSLRRKQTFTDLSATYVFNKDWHERDGLERPAVSLPGSRPRSSTMTKYAPLPSITSTKQSQSQPPPLIRSKTFDVIDTKMKNLPMVDDSSLISNQKLGGEEEPPCLVTVSIEGKTLKEYLSHARDGLLRSRPATRYGLLDQAHEKQLLGISCVSDKPLLYQVRLPQTKEFAETGGMGEAADVEGEDGQDARGEGTDTLTEAADKDEHENDVSNNNNEDNCNNDDEDDHGKDEENNDGEDDSSDKDSDDDDSDDESDDDDDSDGDDDDSDGDDDSDDNSDSEGDEETKEKNVMLYAPAGEQPRGDNDDIHVYFMLPDNSLLLACTTPHWTLAGLLSVVRGVRMDGRRLEVVLDGVHPQDLHAGLTDLGISHNTTIYLLETDR